MPPQSKFGIVSAARKSSEGPYAQEDVDADRRVETVSCAGINRGQSSGTLTASPPGR